MYKGITNLIIGKKSNLSQRLAKKLKNNVALISAEEILNDITVLNSYVGQMINIIFNNFQTASKLGDMSEPEHYIAYSIGATSKVLEFAKEGALKINKIIYTSSSSVYGNNILCKESDEVQPTSLHASLKVANEKLIAQYCNEHSINYTIARIFNMYGGDDYFSVISKLLECCQNGTPFTVANHGSAIRDFIYIDDVVAIYEQLLQVENLPIVNLGTGEGISIKNIIDFLKLHNIDLHVNSIVKEEIKMSTADNNLLLEQLAIKKFIKVDEYLLNEMRNYK